MKGKAFTMANESTSVKRDIFAEIAASRQVLRDNKLIAPQPALLPDRTLKLQKFETAMKLTPLIKMETPEQLRAELLCQREKHLPFLRNLAPSLPETRIILPVKDFDWRLQTETDRANFSAVLDGDGDWKRVAVPHYGEPLGRATAYYRTTVCISEAMLAKGALFLCFNGVDYKAHAFLNGSFLGSHEGFFAPFEFDCSPAARLGENALVIIVENDAICGGNDSWGRDGNLYEGDKLYAATGPGYDDPEVGWHHCPPGMGIYQSVRLEARNSLHVNDLFVRTLSLDGEIEIWLEVWNCHRTRQDISLSLSVHGQNFAKSTINNMKVEQKELGPGVNYLRIPLTVSAPRIWEPASPWLYQLQVKVLDGNGELLDNSSRQFGLRTFHMEEKEEPMGRFFLNNREIRLRGANTMGFEQQDVMKGDWQQLIDDILLAKICNMNFWRLTQRPVQPEVYEYCDRLGLMTQTDLPLFGCLRRNQFCEAVRQAGEMEKLVRAHACNIVVSYINEPFGGGMGKPHRHLLRDELERFFLAANQAVLLTNPDRVIKAVDGDFDPPAPGFPDIHCYCAWYNGAGVDLGKLHKGYWMPVKSAWCYGCGEFGAEGLDPVATMRKYYPDSWLPHTPEEEMTWTPNRIMSENYKGCQTGRFYYMWFDAQKSVSDWVFASQAHQAWATRIMTEAFRRDSRMTSFAIHLFIDAFPAGWMKTIMDVDRNPKSAYFEYREALTPLMVNLRSDRQSFYSGEDVTLEAWICNDDVTARENQILRYNVEIDGELAFSGQSDALVPSCSSRFQGYLRFKAPEVRERTKCVVRLGLTTEEDAVLHDTSFELGIFPVPVTQPQDIRTVYVIGEEKGTAAGLIRKLGMNAELSGNIQSAGIIVVDDMVKAAEIKALLEEKARLGALVVFLEIPPGQHTIAGSSLTVRKCGMNPVHFVSRNTGHPLVDGFKPHDFRFWHDERCGYVTPFLSSTFTVNDESWIPILTSGNGDWKTEWHIEFAVSEKKVGKGFIRICQAELADRVSSNPVAHIFATRLLCNHITES